MKDIIYGNGKNIGAILEIAKNEAISYLNGLDGLPPNQKLECDALEAPDFKEGLGINETLELFKTNYKPYISGCNGSRYFGFVVGGTTPAALAADWLVSTYDQVSPVSDVSVKHEIDTIKLFKKLFGLSESFFGCFVTGGTTSNLVSLAGARQWANEQCGFDSANFGLKSSKEQIKVFAANAHSSIYKSLSILGIGRENLIKVKSLPNREAIDINDLRLKLEANGNNPSIVIGSAGTVNTGDFDDFEALGLLKKDFNFWLHVDGAFGGFASISKNYNHLTKGWNVADSITIDGHKWLNVPYDSAFQFTKQPIFQSRVFQNGNAPYLENNDDFNFVNMVPENSRRWRSLPAWFSLISYGKNGYVEIVEKNCLQAKRIGERIKNSDKLTLLADVKLNIVCFAVKQGLIISTEDLLKRINASNQVFLTPTVLNGIYAIRIAVCNWKTQQSDMDLLWKIINDALNTNIS